MPKILVERKNRKITSVYVCKDKSAVDKIANELLMGFLRDVDESKAELGRMLESGEGTLSENNVFRTEDGGWDNERAFFWDPLICDLEDADARFVVLVCEGRILSDFSFWKTKQEAVLVANQAFSERISDTSWLEQHKNDWAKADEKDETPRAWYGRGNVFGDAYVVQIPHE